MADAPVAEAPKTLAKAPLSRRRKVVAGLVLYLAFEAFALPPAWQPTAWIGRGLLKAYQATLSPCLARAGVHCRFQPTCSHYGAMALEKYGTLSGGLRTAWRLIRCAPWGPPPGEMDLP
jgi:putative membrane protein insertion efficiency factor